jgi:hypothetical protein
MLFTCPNHRSRFSSITSNMFFRTSMTCIFNLSYISLFQS